MIIKTTSILLTSYHSMPFNSFFVFVLFFLLRNVIKFIRIPTVTDKFVILYFTHSVFVEKTNNSRQIKKILPVNINIYKGIQMTWCIYWDIKLIT